MDVDDLYALPNDRFVPERGTLAKALRADGRRDEAKDVAALRKPSVAAWAINQLVRTQGDAVDELVAAGDALRGAHADLVGGRGDVQALRTATERERGAVDTLLDGRPPPALPRRARAERRGRRARRRHAAQRGARRRRA